ncbi:DUF202 domain-containing protein [Arcticibacter eurypsychrophilus]|uniref:DUF202 domain-containing protein n=1 Tax=Arcticibacter eurypsychrophilus TaxID=1434752 RepID=UPI00084D23AC|nr:DUF202 domain-containing protein [Arcticibacter eurypsychrophilus]
MNKFMRRGLVMVAVGVGLNLVGYSIKRNELENYGWAMIVGTILFGVGFLFIFYSFVRKVEYKGIVEERAVVAEKKELRETEASNEDDDLESSPVQS